MAIARAGTAALAGFGAISLDVNARLVTADATLDLSGKSITGTGGGIESTNAPPARPSRPTAPWRRA